MPWKELKGVEDPKRRQAAEAAHGWKHKNLSAATVEEIAKVPGISHSLWHLSSIET